MESNLIMEQSYHGAVLMAETNLTTGLTTSGETVYSEADSGVKEAIEIYFKQFLPFFFPKYEAKGIRGIKNH